MESNNAKVNTLLKRTNLRITFNKFLNNVQSKFSTIGNIKDYSPINEGYEDANFILNTSTGKFVLKIFLADRKIENINSYIKILNESKNISFPTTDIISDYNNGLGIVENTKAKTYYILTKFFEGSNFQNITPTIEDIQNITYYLSQLNTLNFNVVSEYDGWGIKNFAKEYENKNDKLTTDQKLLVKNNLDNFIKIDMKGFSKSVIHGDMQRKHVIKDKNNNYCILDFGCMAYSEKVIELSTYLAWFCLQEDTWKDRDLIIKNILDIYNKVHNLTSKEIESLPTLIKASYSAYYMTTSVMINDGDESEETLDWHKRSKKMLELSNKWE